MPRQITYADLVDAVRAEFPGDFDSVPDWELAGAVAEEFPEFRQPNSPVRLDEASRDLLLTPNRGRPAPILRPQDRPQGPPRFDAELTRKWDTGSGVPPVVPPDPLRTPTLGDTAIELGLTTVPAVVGMGVGALAGGYGAIPGGMAGGALGELLREVYQSQTGLRNDGLSPTNIAAQGVVGGLPLAGAVGKVAGAVLPKALTAAAPQLLKTVGTAAGEGAILGPASVATEALIRDQRLPEATELGYGAVFGGGFGAAAGAGMAGYGAVRAARAPGKIGLTPESLETLFQAFQAAPGPERSAAAQAIVDVAEQLRVAGDPAGGGQILQRLLSEAQVYEQAQLQQYASEFLRNYGAMIDRTTIDVRRETAKDFLRGLRERGASTEILTKVQGILDAIHQAPAPELGPTAEGWYTPYDPTRPLLGPDLDYGAYEPIPGPENFGTLSEAEAGKAAQTLEQTLGQPRQLGSPKLLGPDGKPLPDTRPLPAWEQAQLEESLRYPKPIGPDLPPYWGAGVLEPESAAPPPTAGSLPLPTPKKPLTLGPPAADLPAPPMLRAEGVDAYEAVASGRVGRDDAWMLQWMIEDLREFQFQSGGSTKAQRADAVNDWRPGDPEHLRQGFVPAPHVAGTPIQRTLELILGKSIGDRATVAKQIENYLSGVVGRPGRKGGPGRPVGEAAQAALKLAKAWRAAYDPATGDFDWSRVDDGLLTELGLTSRKDFQKPWLTPNIEGQPRDLVERWSPRDLARQQAAEAAGELPGPPPKFEPGALDPDGLYDARQLIRGLSKTDLERLYSDLADAGPGAVAGDFVADADFGGSWYDVGIGLVGEELERRGLRNFRQPRLVTEGPGSPGGMGVQRLMMEPPERGGGGRGDGPSAPMADGTPVTRESLEAIATDEAMGVEFPDDGPSRFRKSGKDAIVCTNCAEEIIERVGRGRVVGWEEGTNPTSKVAGPEHGARVEGGQGHDFALIDERFLVDPWAVNVEGSGPRAAYDLADPADRAKVRELYGDPTTWIQRRESGSGWDPYTPPLLASDGPPPPPTQADLLPTGEAQPRLPGDVGEVRSAPDRQLPLLVEEVDLFRLTPPPGPKPKKLKLPSLFDDESGVVGDVVSGRARRAASSPTGLRMSEDLVEVLQDAVAASPDAEVAGLLLGDADGRIRQVIRAQNIADDPSGSFAIDPKTIAAAQRLAAKQGWQLLGSWHSQPTGSAEPSKLDLQGSVADVPLLILGTRGSSIQAVKVWQPSRQGMKGQPRAPWLEGTLQIGDPPPADVFGVTPSTASRMIELIPKYRGAPGDAPALQTYLRSHKESLGVEPWFVRAQQFLDEGNPRMAWLEVQAAQVAAAGAGHKIANSPQFAKEVQDRLHAEVNRALAGGPQDPVGALFALYDGRTKYVEGVGRVVIAPTIPSGAAGKGLAVGPGGILDPGLPKIRMPDDQTWAGMTLDALNDALDMVKGDAGHILDDPTKASATRLNRQIAERLILAPSSIGAQRAWVRQMKAQGVSDRDINIALAAHVRQAATYSGKMLAALSTWKRRNGGDIRKIEGIRGAAGDIDDLLIIGAGGRKLGKLGDLAEAHVAKDLIQPGRAWDQVMLLNDLTRQEQGWFSSLELASRGFMLSQFATAARNFHSASGRWGVEAFNDGVQAVAQTLHMRPGKALAHAQRLGDMLRYTPFLRPDGWVMPWHARRASFEQIFQTLLSRGDDRAAALRLLQHSGDEQLLHFLGAVNFGEPAPNVLSKYRIINWAASQRVQNFLTMFNRAQEFTVRPALYTVELRHQLRTRGIDPNQALRSNPADVEALLGGPEELQRVIHAASAAALDFTFSGDIVRKGLGRDAKGQHIPALNTQIIDLINKTPFIRAGYPWPKFNLSAAPRFIWDYGGGGIVEALNHMIGVASGGGLHLNKGRLAIGTRAQHYEANLIPELRRKQLDAQAQYGEALQTLQGLSRQLSVTKRLAARAERRGQAQRAGSEGLPLGDLGERISSLRAEAERLTQAVERQSQIAEAAEAGIKDLKAQETSLGEVVTQANAVRAPRTPTEAIARSVAGMASLGTLGVLLRADQMDKGTKWYQLKYDIPGLGETVIDTRPLAPFTQFLFFGDLVNDISQNTDWDAVWSDLDEGINFEQALWGRYEGKYTMKTMGSEALQAFLSISQAAGTTLALADQLASIGERGFSITQFANDSVVALGDFLARFTIPARQFLSLTDQVSTEESMARLPDTRMGWAAPLAKPLANVPFIGAAVIPETYNQLSGLPLDSHIPMARAWMGISLQKWERIAGEIAEVGVPGTSAYLRTTNNYELDRRLAVHYAQAWAIYADQFVFANTDYLALDTPAARRDFLTAYVFPRFKQYAIGQTLMDYDVGEFREARESGEARRRRLRRERVLQLAQEEGIDLTRGSGAEEPEAPEPQEPDLEPQGEPQALSTGGPPLLEGGPLGSSPGGPPAGPPSIF